MRRPGLKRRTALGAATLMIGANFPDIDVLAVPLGHGLGFRRGLTHGIPALVVLPFVLAGIMRGWSRLRGRGSGATDPPAPAQLLLLSAISILTHPVLDWMNTYGMRWFVPFSGSWSYADSLFIVDPWMWLVLCAGVFLAGSTGECHSLTVAERRELTEAWAPLAREHALPLIVHVGHYCQADAIVLAAAAQQAGASALMQPSIRLRCRSRPARQS